MLTVPVYNQEGQQTGTMELDAAVFDVAPKASVLHIVVRAQEANRRQAIAHTKTRGEVRGGGRKPWAQKHTGRARHGSIRSPLWVGGGTTFGPRAERSYAQKVNVKVRRLALRMALSDRVASGRFVVVEDFVPVGGTTKAAERVLATLLAQVVPGRRAPSTLLVLPAERRRMALSVRNLPRVSGIDAAHLNVRDVLRHEVVVATRDAVARATAVCTPKVTGVRKQAPGQAARDPRAGTPPHA